MPNDRFGWVCCIIFLIFLFVIVVSSLPRIEVLHPNWVIASPVSAQSELGSITLRVRVTGHPNNAAVQLSIVDSAGFELSKSQRSLIDRYEEFTITLNDLPTGFYQVIGVLAEHSGELLYHFSKFEVK